VTKKWQTVPDAQVRHLAETTFDRNIVVVAGAGTGKTTLLVNRLVHLLMREPQPVEITKLVALTFTNKAAAEMKLRLRDRLSSLLHAEAAEPDGCGDPGAVTAADLRERYDVSNAQIVARADAALHGLDKAQIGTLHSFAAHLLRLYPLESGVDPNFRTDDDESRFQDHFAAQWDLWLDRELALPGPQEARWRRLLSVRGLDSLREMAYALRSELIPLDELQRQAASGALPPALRDWFAAKRDRASTLLASRSQAKRLKADAMLDATQALFGLLLEHGVEGLAKLSAEQRQVLDKDVGKKTAGWNEADFAEAEGLIATAQQVCAVDGALTADLLALLCPFVQEVRATFLAQGWVSFDGLLARARALLRGQPGIRERLKHEYQAVLVDEFQDTDPVQYEIVLYLAEQAGRQGDDWRAIELEPGKLFIVGDPKQSIYAFRRADIEAFERVVEKVAASGGIIYPLSTNFRSDARVLEVVNPLFDRLLVRQDHVQPANVPLIVRPNRPSRIGLPGVEVRAVTAGDDEETTSQSVTRQEADQLARWLKDELLAQETLVDAAGRKDRLKPGHVALLFRKLTQAQEYLDALRRHEIAYITDGEKHFYRRQEVVDLINVLRVVENPHDTIALVGVLRSPLGGVTDRELVALRERGGFDYRQAARLSDWKSPCAEAVRLLYARLAGLHRSLSTVPLPEAVDRLFDSLPILELAAASLHGEQAVANLMKVRQMAVELAGRPHLTLTAFVELMIARLDEQPEEAESALAEESLDAVRVLTIHKAKGLEFPVVVLPGLHHGTRRGRDAPSVSHDWTTGVFGINWGDRCNLGAVMVNEKVRLREAAEQRRLFYVGMTRAQERLVLSGGWRGSSSRSEWTFFDLLQEAATGEIGGADASTLRIGPVPLRQTVVMTAERSPGRRKPAPVRLRASKEWDSVAERWKARDQAWNIVRATPAHVTPTGLLTAKGGGAGPVARPAGDAGRARLVGTLAHRVLQHWDFALPPDGLQERIAALCRTGFPLGLPEDVRAVEEELRDLFAAFTASEAYRDLCRAEILGREVPFAMSWEGNRLWAMGYGAGKVQADSSLSPIAHRPLPASCVMEGVIDVVYRLDGKIRLADYKTDRVEDSEIAARASEYGVQARIYREAAARCLGIKDVGCDLIFVRSGTSVSV
jgi:ATP-dependent helicase/nuclease subunit A